MPNMIKTAGDGAAKKDLLGFSIYVDALISVINSRPKEESFSIGLFGDWGSGKSSFMEQMEEKLEEENNFIIIRMKSERC